MTLFRIAPAPRTPAARGLVSRLRAAWAAHRAAAQLATLDDHLLSDIGFVRVPETGRAHLVA